MVTITGHIQDGAVILDKPINLPNGAEVQVKYADVSEPYVAPSGGPIDVSRVAPCLRQIAEEINRDRGRTETAEEAENRRHANEALDRFTVESGLPSITNEEIDALLAESYADNH